MLPYGRQVIDDDDIAAVTSVLRGDFLTTGPAAQEFEQALAGITGAREAVVCGNGTLALHLAALAAGIGPGDTAIVPSLTFLATANCVRYCGGEVLFADVDPDTALMTAQTFRDALETARRTGKRVKAVFPVHLTGQMVDMGQIHAIAADGGITVITDSCHALGSVQNGMRAGAGRLEDMAVFSFHPVKTIAMGEGGAVTTNDPALAAHMRRLRSHGMVMRPTDPAYPEQALDEAGAPNPWYYEMPELGFNYRATDMQCALGLSQLRKLDRFIARRRALVALYDRLLEPLAPAILPPHKVPGCTPGWHLYAARIDFDALGLSRAMVMNRLATRKVGSQVHYLPVHRQPYYRGLYGDLSLPGADRYYARTLSLPLYPTLTDDDVHYVVETLRDVTGL